MIFDLIINIELILLIKTKYFKTRSLLIKATKIKIEY